MKSRVGVRLSKRTSLPIDSQTVPDLQERKPPEAPQCRMLEGFEGRPPQPFTDSYHRVLQLKVFRVKGLTVDLKHPPAIPKNCIQGVGFLENRGCIHRDPGIDGVPREAWCQDYARDVLTDTNNIQQCPAGLHRPEELPAPPVI